MGSNTVTFAEKKFDGGTTVVKEEVTGLISENLDNPLYEIMDKLRGLNMQICAKNYPLDSVTSSATVIPDGTVTASSRCPRGAAD